MTGENVEIHNDTKCPHCQSIIEDSATMCRYCQLPTKGWKKKIAPVRTILELLAFLTSAIAIVFLLNTSFQTNESLHAQHEAIQVQAEALRRTDSSLALINVQLQLNREANALQQALYEVSLKSREDAEIKMREELRPRVDLIDPTCDLRDSAIALILNIKNSGKSTASDVVLELDAKTEDLQILGSRVQWEFSVIFPNKKKVIPIRYSTEGKYIRANLLWNWKETRISDTLLKYMAWSVSPDDSSCTCKFMSDDQAALIWQD